MMDDMSPKQMNMKRTQELKIRFAHPLVNALKNDIMKKIKNKWNTSGIKS